jgi:magnesium transporter
MLKYYVRNTNDEAFRQLPGYSDQSGLWVYGEQPQANELDVLSEQFDLDRNILRDVMDKDELPRLEVSDGGLYVFFRSVLRNKHGEIESAPVLVVLTPRVFVSLSLTNAISDQKIAAAAHMAPTEDQGNLLLATFTALVTDYESSIQRTGRYIKDIGHRLKTHEVNNSDFIHFVTVEDNLGIYSLNLTSMLTVAERLRDNKSNHLSREHIESTDDIILHLRQLLVSVQTLTQTVTSIRNAYSTIANNNLNIRMKRLTVLTVLIALPNVFYGMYGMNVVLPFQDSPGAYAFIVGFTAVLILLVYVLAKRFRLF